jgi:diguanylate cyclase (GGDEF)-like protein
VYSLNATVDPHQLSSVLKDQKLPSSWRVGVIDSAGGIVARTHDAEKFVGKKVTQALLQRMSRSDEDAFESQTLEGVPVLTAYSRSPSTRWSVALGMPLKELTAGLRQTLAWLIVATFAALLGGLSLAWFIGGRIARSITALTRPALALGSGQRLAIPSLHFREANQMRQALLDAGATLDRAQYDAQHDVLTGLANRVLFHIVVNQQLAMCRRNATELAVLYVDLDGFKAVNDTHGHAVGDQLLRAVAARIKSSIRESDVAARLGGDEFAIALIHAGLDNAKTFADKLMEIVSNPYRIGDVETKVSASIGVAAFPVSATDVDTLLKKADHAMYQAKAFGKQRVQAAAGIKSTAAA